MNSSIVPRFPPAAALASVLVGVGAASLAAQTPDSLGPRGPAAEAQTVRSLAWMAGHWTGELNGARIEEGWFGPAGGGMSGMFRRIQDGQAIVYELLLLEEEPDGVFFRFRHIRPGWQPVQRETLEYRLVRAEGRKAWFESTGEEARPGTPRSFTYERTAEDRLLVRATGWDGSSFGLDYQLRP